MSIQFNWKQAQISESKRQSVQYAYFAWKTRKSPNKLPFDCGRNKWSVPTVSLLCSALSVQCSAWLLHLFSITVVFLSPAHGSQQGYSSQWSLSCSCLVGFFWFTWVTQRSLPLYFPNPSQNHMAMIKVFDTCLCYVFSFLSKGKSWGSQFLCVYVVLSSRY